jgi:hypothetical protein
MCTRCQQSPTGARRCAFDENGVFTAHNFQCLTANALMEHVGNRSIQGAKCYGAVNVSDSWLIVMCWNGTGTVERMMRVDGTNGRLLTVDDTEAALCALQVAT